MGLDEHCIEYHSVADAYFLPSVPFISFRPISSVGKYPQCTQLLELQINKQMATTKFHRVVFVYVRYTYTIYIERKEEKMCEVLTNNGQQHIVQQKCDGYNDKDQLT